MRKHLHLVALLGAITFGGIMAAQADSGKTTKCPTTGCCKMSCCKTDCGKCCKDGKCSMGCCKGGHGVKGAAGAGRCDK